MFGLGRPLAEEVIDAEDEKTAAMMLYQHEVQVDDYAAIGFGYEGEGVVAASDWIRLGVHWMTNTHIDALCHAFHRGRGFNGRPIDEMITEKERGKIGTIQDNPAVVTRGVLVDVPRIRGSEFLKPGDPVRVDDLRKGAPDIQPGDALVVRVGRSLAPVVLPDSTGASGDPHGDWACLHVDCIDFAAEKDVAILATDGPGDNFPPTTPDCSVPIHILTQVYLGLPLVHHLELEALAAACAAEGRNTFGFVVAPLNIVGGTGSPVSPVAIL